MSALTVHQQRGIFRTALIGLLILLALMLLGLRHYDPPLERGVIIAFGAPEAMDDRTQNAGDQSEKINAVASEQTTEQDLETPENSVTQRTDLVPTDGEQQMAERDLNSTASEQASEQMMQTEDETVSVESEKKPEADAATQEALKRILAGKNTLNQDKQSSGQDEISEQAKGSQLSDEPSTSPYDLGIGLDGDGNYLLGGRRAVHKEIIVQDCNQAGRVVVSIEVNQNGQVVSAMPGVRGTTNNASCLLDPAKRAALATEFNSDSRAPTRQIGKIIYVFRLSE